MSTIDMIIVTSLLDMIIFMLMAFNVHYQKKVEAQEVLIKTLRDQIFKLGLLANAATWDTNDYGKLCEKEFNAVVAKYE